MSRIHVHPGLIDNHAAGVARSDAFLNEQMGVIKPASGPPRDRSHEGTIEINVRRLIRGDGNQRAVRRQANGIAYRGGENGGLCRKINGVTLPREDGP